MIETLKTIVRFSRKALFGSPPPASRPARLWSNEELRQFAPLFTGDVLNVSAWRDEDKEGKLYSEYFSSANRYFTSNYPGWRGNEADAHTDFMIDLEESLPDELESSFDVIFNHTTLEHIYEVRCAFENLCRLSRDIVIIVVPFIQHLHGPPDGDFWRFSPYCLRRLFGDNGYNCIYESYGPEDGGVKYLFSVGSTQPERWAEHEPFSYAPENFIDHVETPL